MPAMSLEEINETPLKNERLNQSMDESIVQCNQMLHGSINFDDYSIQQEQQIDRSMQSERGMAQSGLNSPEKGKEIDTQVMMSPISNIGNQQNK